MKHIPGISGEVGDMRAGEIQKRGGDIEGGGGGESGGDRRHCSSLRLAVVLWTLPSLSSSSRLQSFHGFCTEMRTLIYSQAFDWLVGPNNTRLCLLCFYNILKYSK